MICMTPEEICARYDALVERAIEVVRAMNVGPWDDFDEDAEDYARLSVKGETATLIWPSATARYEDGAELDENSTKMPVRLLLIPIPEFAMWQAEQVEAHEKQRTRKVRASNARKNREDRATYERLRERFE